MSKAILMLFLVLNSITKDGITAELDILAQERVYPIRVSCKDRPNDLGILGSAFAINSTYMITALHNFDNQKLTCDDELKEIYIYESASKFNTADRTKKISGDQKFSYIYKKGESKVERVSSSGLVDAIAFSISTDGELIRKRFCKSKKRPAIGMDIYLGAYHKIVENLKYTFRSGKIDRLNGALGTRNPGYSTTQLNFFPGNSGAPVLDSDGCVMGVVSARTSNNLSQAQALNNTDFNHFVPLHLLGELDKFWSLPKESRYSIKSYISIGKYYPIFGKDDKSAGRFKNIASFSPDYTSSDVEKFAKSLSKELISKLGKGGSKKATFSIDGNILRSDSSVTVHVSKWQTANDGPLKPMQRPIQSRIHPHRLGTGTTGMNLQTIFDNLALGRWSSKPPLLGLRNPDGTYKEALDIADSKVVLNITLTTVSGSVYVYKLSDGSFSFDKDHTKSTHTFEEVPGRLPLIYLNEVTVAGRFQEHHDGLKLELREELIRELEGKLNITELSLDEIEDRNNQLRLIKPSLTKLSTLNEQPTINYIMRISLVINRR